MPRAGKKSVRAGIAAWIGAAHFQLRSAAKLDARSSAATIGIDRGAGPLLNQKRRAVRVRGSMGEGSVREQLNPGSHGVFNRNERAIPYLRRKQHKRFGSGIRVVPTARVQWSAIPVIVDQQR